MEPGFLLAHSYPITERFPHRYPGPAVFPCKSGELPDRQALIEFSGHGPVPLSSPSPSRNAGCEGKPHGRPVYRLDRSVYPPTGSPGESATVWVAQIGSPHMYAEEYVSVAFQISQTPYLHFTFYGLPFFPGFIAALVLLVGNGFVQIRVVYECSKLLLAFLLLFGRFALI